MTLLEKLFERHFPNPPDALRQFQANLGKVKLLFDLAAQLRELEFPPYPEFDEGMPSLIYYYLPGTRWGTGGKTPLAKSTDPDFVYASNGIGLNLGCPVRLARALDILFRLPEPERQECLEGLALPSKHFATIEELLWLSVWSGIREIRRGGIVPGNTGTKNVDWFLKVKWESMFLETKFRPADWPRLTDQNTHSPMDGFLLGKASDQFPRKRKKDSTAFHLVGLTGFAEPDPHFISLCDDSLSQHRHINGIIFRTMLGPTYLFTRSKRVRAKLAPLFDQQIPMDNYPLHYSVQFHRGQRAERIVERGMVRVQPKESFTLHYCVTTQLPAKKRLKVSPEPYRLQIAEHKPDGEPVFTVITPRIWVDAAK